MKMPNLSSLLNTFILLISSGLAVILSKKAISISLLTKETMNYLSGMKIKQFIKLDIGLERFLFSLLSITLQTNI